MGYTKSPQVLAEEKISTFMIGGVMLAILAGILIGLQVSADESNTFLWAGGIIAGAVAQVLVLIAVIAYGVSMGRRASPDLG